MNKAPNRSRDLRNDMLAKQLGEALAMKETEKAIVNPCDPKSVMPYNWSITPGLHTCTVPDCSHPDDVHFEYRMIKGRQKVRVRCFSCKTKTAWGQYPQEVASLWHKDKQC